MLDQVPPYISESDLYARAELKTIASYSTRAIKETQRLIQNLATVVAKPVDPLADSSNREAEIADLLPDDINSKLNELNDAFIQTLDVSLGSDNVLTSEGKVESKLTTEGATINAHPLDQILDADTCRYKRLEDAFNQNCKQLETSQDDCIDARQRYEPYIPQFVSFRSAIATSMGDDPPLEEEALAHLDSSVTVTRDFICPITREPYEDPVTTPCGHHFSRKAILQVLEVEGASIKCPAPGCSGIIRNAGVLKENPKINKLTQKWLRNQKRLRAQEAQNVERI